MKLITIMLVLVWLLAGIQPCRANDVTSTPSAPDNNGILVIPEGTTRLIIINEPSYLQQETQLLEQTQIAYFALWSVMVIGVGLVLHGM